MKKTIGKTTGNEQSVVENREVSCSDKVLGVFLPKSYFIRSEGFSAPCLHLLASLFSLHILMGYLLIGGGYPSYSIIYTKLLYRGSP